jgi:hypothetical protein
VDRHELPRGSSARVALTASPPTTTLCSGNAGSPRNRRRRRRKIIGQLKVRDHPLTQNPHLVALSAAGVSIWLDDLSRNRLQTGFPQELIDNGNLVLTTSHYVR